MGFSLLFDERTDFYFTRRANESPGDLRLSAFAEEVFNSDGTLTEIFNRKPLDQANIRRRLDIFFDMEEDCCHKTLADFADGFITALRFLENSTRSGQKIARDKWAADAAAAYRECLTRLSSGLKNAGVKSAGLAGLLNLTDGIIKSSEFVGLAFELDEIFKTLSRARYSMEIDLPKKRVRFWGETEAPNRGGGFDEAFAPLGLVSPDKDMVPFPDDELNYFELTVLSKIGRAHPGALKALDGFAIKRVPFIDASVESVHTEIKFLLAYRSFMDSRRKAGVPFAYPGVAGSFSEAHIKGGRTPEAQVKDFRELTPNDFAVKRGREFAFVSGPASCGKKTYAAMVAQIHLLYSQGLPVPCEEASLAAFKDIKHYAAREENPKAAAGRLADEIGWLKRICDDAKDGSLFVFHNIFAGAAAYETETLYRKFICALAKKNCAALFVTSKDELPGAIPEIESITLDTNHKASLADGAADNRDDPYENELSGAPS
ncbi:MAG: hypothetical protein FWF03_00625 [Defluviitaleaceae bacterium]|nr:hypothetical protein [Defluviitaleaceae bacterium]